MKCGVVGGEEGIGKYLGKEDVELHRGDGKWK